MKPSKKISFSFLLLIPPIIIFLIALLIIFIPLPAPLPQPASHARNLPAAILTGILGLTWVILLSSYVIQSFLSAGHVLDPTFTSMGFKGNSYLIIGMQYLGSKEGRNITALFLPGRALQNPLLEIRVETNINQNIAIGNGRPLSGCNDCKKVDNSSLQLENIQIYAQDSNWAKTTLNESQIASLIKRLLDESDGTGSREIYIQPGTIWLRSRPSAKFEEKNVQNYLDILLNLAKIIERSN